MLFDIKKEKEKKKTQQKNRPPYIQELAIEHVKELFGAYKAKVRVTELMCL